MIVFCSNLNMCSTSKCMEERRKEDSHTVLWVCDWWALEKPSICCSRKFNTSPLGSLSSVACFHFFDGGRRIIIIYIYISYSWLSKSQREESELMPKVKISSPGCSRLLPRQAKSLMTFVTFKTTNFTVLSAFTIHPFRLNSKAQSPPSLLSI